MKIPDWFDVANYECTKNWAAGEWANAIYNRLAIGQMFDMRGQAKSNGRDVYLSTALEVFGVGATDSQNSTIDVWNEVIKQIHYTPEKIIKISGKSFYNQEANAVSVVDLRHVGALYTELIDGLDDDTIDYLAGVLVRHPSHETIEIGRKTVEERSVDLGRMPGYWNNSLLVSINLDMPKDMLIEQVDRLIDQSRKKYNIQHLGKPTSPVDFRRWYETKILAYYDLLLLAKINEVSLTNQQVGARLFPKEFDVALSDRVRKVIKPLSTYVFQESTRIMLAIASNMERGPKKTDPE